jgi:hypothetical protein
VKLLQNADVVDQFLQAQTLPAREADMGISEQLAGAVLFNAGVSCIIVLRSVSVQVMSVMLLYRLHMHEPISYV